MGYLHYPHDKSHLRALVRAFEASGIESLMFTSASVRKYKDMGNVDGREREWLKGFFGELIFVLGKVESQHCFRVQVFQKLFSPLFDFPRSNSQKLAFSISRTKPFLQSLLLWGPLPSLQVENEYGNIGYEDFPRDKSHLLDIERVYGEEGVESLLFTSDSPYLVDDWGNVDGRERDGLFYKKSLCYNTLLVINWHKLTKQYSSFCEYCKLLDGVCKKNAFTYSNSTHKKVQRTM